MALIPSDPLEIYTIITNLKNTSSTGQDQIAVKPLKIVAQWIAPVLSILINHTFANGIFPDQLKVAKITPIHKSGDKTLLSNYRPISLLNTFSKIYEKAFLNRLYSFLNKNNIIQSNQFGFRKNHSTQSALISFIDMLTEKLDNNEYAVALFIDLSKAFDTVDHQILLNKLFKYGIRGKANDFVKSYLNNRMQYVDLNGTTSELRKIECGVPQGSILGPVLFILYVNDMHCCSHLLKLFLFADDTTILYSAKNVTDLYKIINNELKKLTIWFEQNKLSLNISKTTYMLFKNHKLPLELPILLLNDNQIPLVQHTKFLGVEIDNKLNWANHIKIIENKLSSILFIIKKIRHKLNTKTALKLYDNQFSTNLLSHNMGEDI